MHFWTRRWEETMTVGKNKAAKRWSIQPRHWIRGRDFVLLLFLANSSPYSPCALLKHPHTGTFYIFNLASSSFAFFLAFLLSACKTLAATVAILRTQWKVEVHRNLTTCWNEPRDALRWTWKVGKKSGLLSSCPELESGQNGQRIWQASPWLSKTFQ